MLRRHGIGTRGPAPFPARRLRRPARAGAGARARAPHRRRSPRRARAAGLLLHRPPCRHQRRCLAVHGDRRRLRLHLGELHVTPRNPDARFASGLARRVAKDLAAAGWELERVSTDGGNEFRSEAFTAEITRLGAACTRISPERPQSNGFVERVQRTILEECWKPARYLIPKYMGLRRELERYLAYYNYDRAHTGRLTQGRTPAEVLGAAKMYR